MRRLNHRQSTILNRGIVHRRQGEVRISKLMKVDDPASRFQGFYDAWFHSKCFMESWDGGVLSVGPRTWKFMLMPRGA